MNEQNTNNIPNSERLVSALRGLTPRLIRLFARKGVPITEKALRRQLYPSPFERVVCRYSWIHDIWSGLVEIGRPDRAAFLSAPFAVLPEAKRKKMRFIEWLDQVGKLYGSIVALAVSGNVVLMDVKRYELAELLTADLIR